MNIYVREKKPLTFLLIFTCLKSELKIQIFLYHRNLQEKQSGFESVLSSDVARSEIWAVEKKNLIDGSLIHSTTTTQHLLILCTMHFSYDI